MPQFDPNVWPPQLFWLAVLFIILVILMAKVALPPIAEILEEREARIDDQLRKAENLKRDAEDAAEAYEKTISAARADAQAVLQAVRDEAQVEATRRSAELSQRLHTELATAEARIAEARNRAIAELKDVATDLVGSITERLIGESYERAKIAATVDAVMREAA